MLILMVEGDEGLVYVYAKAGSILVKRGERVKKSQPLGRVGEISVPSWSLTSKSRPQPSLSSPTLPKGWHFFTLSPPFLPIYYHVLKSSRTVIATPEGRAYLSIRGTPAMAKGGVGDVLSGILVALLGRGHACRRSPKAWCLSARPGGRDSGKEKAQREP